MLDPIRVLLVDSRADAGVPIVELLGASSAVTVAAVLSPDEAIAHLEDDEFDVLVSEYTLPEMTGCELLTTVRRAGFDRPCVFISEGSERAQDAAIRVGAHTLLRREALSSADLHVTLRCAHESYKRTQRIERLAMRDEATGLLNRRGFLDALDKAVSRHKRHGVGALALIYADVDSLKLVNDCHGHGAGDFLLCTVGARIQDCVRTTDAVGRVGGDEFAVVVEGLTEAEHIQHVVRKIQLHISIPAAFGATVLLPGLSIGTAIYGDGLDTPERLMRAADEAMYEAKGQRKRPNPLL